MSRFIYALYRSGSFCICSSASEESMEITLELGGENYVFWGGREGYETLLNTDMKFELDNFARFLRMAVNYAEEIGFKGQLLTELKPKEPMKSQNSIPNSIHNFPLSNSYLLSKFITIPFYENAQNVQLLDIATL